MQHDEFPKGSVWLVGAGPGDPDLLTRKAVRLIEAADIVYYDALVGPGVLALVPTGVERVSVGKRAGRHSKDQGSIDAMLVTAASAGRRVVRLKGGDPSIFGRSAEEMTALRKAGYVVQVCPGVTAASAAAASAGVSLSLRGVAREIRFVTAHSRNGAALDLDWAGLVMGQATLAFYMGRSAAGELSRRLIETGLDRATPVLIACNVSLEDERRLSTRLDLLDIATRAFAEDAPTLFLIGEAVRGACVAPAMEAGVYDAVS